jgi:hypothetical protein
MTPWICFLGLLLHIWWLKTTESYSLTLWTLEVQNLYQWAKIKVWAGPRSLWRFWRNLFLLDSSFWWLPACLGLWPHHSSFQDENLPVSLFHVYIAFPVSIFPLPSLSLHLELTEIIQDNLTFKNPFHLRWHLKSQRIQMWLYVWEPSLACYTDWGAPLHSSAIMYSSSVYFAWTYFCCSTCVTSQGE